MKAYTYLIRHVPTNRVYYGVRFANKVEPDEDLWIRYFTSSVQVHKLIESTGPESFEFEVRKIFDNKEDAIRWETCVLRRCKVLHNNRWLNANVAGHIIATEEGRKIISETHKGKPKTEEHKQKIRNSNIGKKKPLRGNEYRALMSKLKSGKNNPMYGKGCTLERAAKISAANKGKIPINKGVPMSDEQKAKIRATKAANPTKMSAESIARRVSKQIGQKRQKQYCPHCCRDIAIGWYHIHGPNCRTLKS